MHVMDGARGVTGLVTDDERLPQGPGEPKRACEQGYFHRSLRSLRTCEDTSPLLRLCRLVVPRSLRSARNSGVCWTLWATALLLILSPPALE